MLFDKPSIFSKLVLISSIFIIFKSLSNCKLIISKKLSFSLNFIWLMLTPSSSKYSPFIIALEKTFFFLL